MVSREINIILLYIFEKGLSDQNSQWESNVFDRFDGYLCLFSLKWLPVAFTKKNDMTYI